MVLPAHIADLAARLLGLWPSWMRSTTTFPQLAAVLAAPMQDLEDALQDLLLDTLIDTAEGAQLDRLGRVVGVDRGDASDAFYARLIAARILSSLTRGEAERLATVLRTLTGDQGPVHVIPLKPAGLQLTATASTGRLSGAEGAQVRAWMQEIVAAGVSLDHIVEAPPSPFTFDHIASNSPTGKGWDEGQWAESMQEAP